MLKKVKSFKLNKKRKIVLFIFTIIVLSEFFYQVAFNASYNSTIELYLDGKHEASL
jgi:hypothetical protein